MDKISITIKDKCFEILSDLKFHCSCEFPSSQIASVIKDLRNDGYDFWVNRTGSIWAKNMLCIKCGNIKPHRKLLSLEKINQAIERIQFTSIIRERVLKLYENKDTFTSGRDRLEIDHRITPDRESEKPLPDPITDEELKKRYMVLTRVNNHIKREACKKCIQTDTRQKSITGINFFYEGTLKYEKTCNGCFWAFPEIWKEELNKILEIK